METQLEIVCKQSTESYGPHQNFDNVAMSNNINSKTSLNNNSQWLGSTIQNFLNKLRELTKSEKQSHHHKHVEDDWDIPFERIRMCRNDFHSCGSQGDVFYGKLSNTPIAIKRVTDVSLTKIRHLRELNHKNIIKFRGISENSSFCYIIMEWCPYGTLHDHIHSGRQLSSTILSNFAYQIASGMKYLHSKNIIHRDLKPSNILLTHNDVLKISDFGTHKVFNDKLPVFSSSSYAGTHAYMAPEVIRSDPYSFPVDVWSYGVVLWEILTGDEPYKNLNNSLVIWVVGNNLFLLPIPDSFPEGFSRILNGCWKAKPEERLTFQQICMIMKGAIHEVDKISKERWLPLQAEWKREIRVELKKRLQFDNKPSEDQICRQKALEEEARRISELAEKRRNKNNNLYLKLQELGMLIQRQREEVQKEREVVQKEREEVSIQKENLLEREQAVTRLEAEMAKRTQEMNRLKEQSTYLSLIEDELNRKGITLDCFQNKPRNNEDDSKDNNLSETDESINTNL